MAAVRAVTKAMPDITQPETVVVVQRRLDGQSQGKDTPRGQPSQKVAASYQEVARAKPLDDRITILGIPVEQITPVTHAALASLVGEINHLRNVVKRNERQAEKRGRGDAQTDAAILEPEAFVRQLAVVLGQPPGAGNTWVIVLVHVSTYEDIRRSSGLLAANSALADVARRLKEVRLSPAHMQTESDAAPHGASPSVAAAEAMPVPFALLGYVGGSNLAGVVTLSEGSLNTTNLAQTVRGHLAGGYVVGGIDMALAITVAAAAAGSGESPLLALGRADHILRTH